MHNNATTYFFELLQMSVGRREGLSGTPVKEEWKAMFRTAREQALVGVFTEAVCRLPEEMRPPRKPLTRLCSEVVMIEDANRRLFGKCCDLTEALVAGGFDSCILKGQGMAMLYPKPLLRHSGDIDVWMKSSGLSPHPLKQERDPRQGEGCKSVEDTIYNYARTKGTIADAVYHHLGIPLTIERADDGKVTIAASDNAADDVEMHFRPSFMFCPRHNRRMQEWFDEQWPLQQKHTVQVKAEFFAPGRKDEACSFCCPTPSFNAIYCLAHIYRHLFDEGVGLRQLLDYYYVIKAYNADTDDTRHATTLANLKRFGLYRFAQAVMYVLHEVFALPESEMLVPMNEKTGRFLLDEILRAGNFGKYDDRVNIQANETPFHKFIRRQRYSLRLLRYFPSEVLWQPYFKFWHRRWRLRHGWIKSMSED